MCDATVAGNTPCTRQINLLSADVRFVMDEKNPLPSEGVVKVPPLRDAYRDVSDRAAHGAVAERVRVRGSEKLTL